LYKEGSRWIAHCLELDVLGDGATRHDAISMLGDAIITQIEASIAHRSPQCLFSPADAKFFEMYAAGKDVTDGQVELRFHHEPPEDRPVTIESLDTREWMETADSDGDMMLAEA
jgi:hypothetical protein